jgi:predicted PurR-regulated permease PerM
LIVGLVQFGSAAMALAAAGVALVITSLEGWLLDPVLMGKAERMNSVAVLVGLVFWTSVWGAWGAFLAVPMLAIMKAVCDHNAQLRPIAKLLSD